MKISRPPRRSLSPFGLSEHKKDFFDHLFDEIKEQFPESDAPENPEFNKFLDVMAIPALMRKCVEAPANDCPELPRVCNFLVNVRQQLRDELLFDAVYRGMEYLFDRKTEIFLIDHHDQEHCEKMGWPETYRDVVLFSRERDILVGQYFEPITRDHPGQFSEFISKWSETENLDRLLHLLDFLKGSNDPTFEFYLTFSHPGLNRVVRNKPLVEALHGKAKPLIEKLSSPTWDSDIHKAFNI